MEPNQWYRLYRVQVRNYRIRQIFDQDADVHPVYVPSENSPVIGYVLTSSSNGFIDDNQGTAGPINAVAESLPTPVHENVNKDAGGNSESNSDGSVPSMETLNGTLVYSGQAYPRS